MSKPFTLNRRLFAWPYVVFMMFFVVLPLVMILVGAFKSGDELSFDNITRFFTSSTALKNLWFSIQMGIATTLICLLLGYPAALILSRMKPSTGMLISTLFILPMWINMLLRTLGTKTLLIMLFGKDLGVGAVLFGLVYNFLPFMIMPLYTTLSNMDKSYSEAAQDLGAKPMTVLFRTVVPLSFPGIVSGITMVFVPTISTFVITSMLSSGNVTMFGDLIYEYFMGNTRNPGVGSVMSIVMLVIVLVSNVFLNRYSDNSAVSKGGSNI